LKPELCGRLDYRIRVFPRHELLTHRFELGLMLWI
jgi:starch phosphorylase